MPSAPPNWCSQTHDSRRVAVSLLILCALCYWSSRSGAADRTDVGGVHAQRLALLRDEHQLVLVGHVGDANHRTVPVARLDVDDAVAAP